MFKRKKKSQIHACNSSTGESKAGGFQVQGQPALYKETWSQKKFLEKKKGGSIYYFIPEYSYQ